MTVCRFYQQGYCKYGNSCRFEHPNSAQRSAQPSTNRFGALSGGTQDLLSKYHVTAEVVEKDLTSDAPQWILSAYAPGRDAPEQLFGGFPREQSFEELRLHYYVGKAAGNEEAVLNEAQQLWQNARQQMDNAVRNPNDAARFIVEGENRHPNRHDVCREGTQGAPFGEFDRGRSSAPANVFAADSSTTAGGAFGQRPNPFGQPQAGPAFGQAAFGQASQLGSSSSSSAFGQPSALGAKPSPFGAPAFGQPSQPGASNPFGQSQQTQGSAFGQASQLGAKPNPFASSSGASPFASAGTSNNVNTPAANPFATSAQSNQAPNPFSNNANQSSPFAQAAQQQQSPFGQPAQQQSRSPFAQANPFSTNQAATPAADNPFARQPQQPQQQQQSLFGRPAAEAQPPFGQQQRVSNETSTSSPYPPGSTRQHPLVTDYISKDMTGRLDRFKGGPVTYKAGTPGFRTSDGTWGRIWFPDGPPGYNKDTEVPSEQHDEASKAQWAQFAQTGTFANGVMPELPPPRECTIWDF